MTSSKKKRMSLLDNLAAAGAPTASPSTMGNNRALRSARDAVDAHRVWDLDPNQISNLRIEDRLAPEDIADLQDAIETNGQTVPILVRRDPEHEDRYLLVYGRRRLEAVRNSDKVEKIRAIVANLDQDQSTRAQISENMARRDLTFIEKALFAKELIESGFGNQSQVAEVLTVAKSAISMALAIVDAVSIDLIRAIGPAPGVGRPRWDNLGRMITDLGLDPATLVEVAERVHSDESIAILSGRAPSDTDVSVRALTAVEKALTPSAKPTSDATPRIKARSRVLSLAGEPTGKVRRTSKGLSIDLHNSAFADWVEDEAYELIKELHARWQQQTQK